MPNPNYDNIYEILARAYDATNCDFWFVLRNVLYRGAEEANYLSFQFDDDDGKDFKRNKIYLEEMILNLPDMMDHQGNVLTRHRDDISEALTLARYLIAIERDQTAGQLDMLEERLRNPRRSEDRQMSRAA